MCRKKCSVIWEPVNVEYPHEIKDFIAHQIKERTHKINSNIETIKNADSATVWDLNTLQQSISYNERMLEILNVALESYKK